MIDKPRPEANPAPLASLDEWEDDLKRRYPEPMDEGAAAAALGSEKKAAEKFRDYKNDVRPGVREFYRLNHRYQTVDFASWKRQRSRGAETQIARHTGSALGLPTLT